MDGNGESAAADRSANLGEQLKYISNISWGTLRELGQAERTAEREEPTKTQDQPRLQLCSRDYSALG